MTHFGQVGNDMRRIDALDQQSFDSFISRNVAGIILAATVLSVTS